MKMLGIICVLFGVVLLLTKGEFNRLIHTSFSIGDIWMLIAAMAFAIYSVLLRKKPKPISVWSFQFTTYIIGVILLFPLMLIEQKSQPAVPLNLTAAYGILYGGIFASLVGFILWNKAVIAIGPVKAGMIYYTLPIFSGGLGAVFLGEAMTVNHLYSTFLITSGILIANWKNNPPLKSIRDPHPVDSKSISIQKSR